MATNNPVNNTMISLTFSDNTKGIVGTTTNDNAGTGFVGEFLTASAGSTDISNNTATNIITLSLTAGDWEVWGIVHFVQAAGTTASTLVSGISTTSATFTESRNQLSGLSWSTGAANYMPAPRQRVSIPTTTTVYLIGFATFAVSTMTTTGDIFARRIR